MQKVEIKKWSEINYENLRQWLIPLWPRNNEFRVVAYIQHMQRTLAEWSITKHKVVLEILTESPDWRNNKQFLA